MELALLCLLHVTHLLSLSQYLHIHFLRFEYLVLLFRQQLSLDLGRSDFIIVERFGHRIWMFDLSCLDLCFRGVLSFGLCFFLELILIFNRISKLLHLIFSQLSYHPYLWDLSIDISFYAFCSFVYFKLPKGQSFFSIVSKTVF